MYWISGPLYLAGWDEDYWRWLYLVIDRIGDKMEPRAEQTRVNGWFEYLVEGPADGMGCVSCRQWQLQGESEESGRATRLPLPASASASACASAMPVPPALSLFGVCMFGVLVTGFDTSRLAAMRCDGRKRWWRRRWWWRRRGRRWSRVRPRADPGSRDQGNWQHLDHTIEASGPRTHPGTTPTHNARA